ncbi:bifunctional adenosylcobinamide kinase/adenosylcobinamide-phosphate guanylyltransferase [Bacillus xiapuensis]|uniref:bifunctional adenosylcobinamide kinase/adenosylcobinamide-phosphate guanylyltransferase n=1 Tax=Bacillus xiapuensis TaxID=2014075 RepID=UPI000C24923F|nr:bifunctional adenosylcobinamide kinase/adenosylcobinamide-phosphate guanylyltransferase [Bacillus xiapuensis]
MHLITGGAFNGKKKWVIAAYQLDAIPHLWHSFYKEGKLPEWTEDTVILEGMERYVRRLLDGEDTPDAVRSCWKAELESWVAWESQRSERRLILIGTDITKGIVPANAFDRKWRDAAGWCFQEAAAQAERVISIWYGLPQRLK